jgi:hypothetical protein
MMSLDTKTLIFIVLVGYFSSVFVFLLQGVLNKTKNRNMFLYILGKILQGINWIIYFRGPEQLNNTMMSVASAFLFVGLAFEIYCFISLRK